MKGRRRDVVSRRHFLERVGRASAGVACGACLPHLIAGCAAAAWVSYERAGFRLSVARKAFGDGDGVLLDVRELPAPVYVHRHGDGTFTAVLTRCTHQGCTAAPTGPRIVCPCHGSEYAPNGVVVQGPAERNLRKYAVRADDDRIWIDLAADAATRDEEET